MSKWYQGDGNNSDVVLYSQVRLARNVADSPFPNRMNKELCKSLTKRIWATIKSSNEANEYNLINLNDVDTATSISYAEKQLISKRFAKQKNGSFLLSTNKDVSIMICEEDHIKINAFESGQNIKAAYKKSQVVDDIFINNLNIAFSEKLGFLTASPMNLGTGLKASFVLHLPALANKNAIYQLSAMVSKLGLSLRELNKNGAGDIYILSNLVTLGISEESAMQNLDAICEQIVKQERSAREMLKNDVEFEDNIYRTLGILKMARQINTEEFLNSISLVRLGVSLGYFNIDYKVIGDMLFDMQDASLVVSANAELSEDMCNKLRAKLVREKLD